MLTPCARLVYDRPINRACPLALWERVRERATHPGRTLSLTLPQWGRERRRLNARPAVDKPPRLPVEAVVVPAVAPRLGVGHRNRLAKQMTEVERAHRAVSHYGNLPRSPAPLLPCA